MKKREQTVRLDCPKSCRFRTSMGGDWMCDWSYIMLQEGKIEGNQMERPCGVGKECTVYEKGNKKKRNGIKITPREVEEMKLYEMQQVSEKLSKDHRRGKI